jgi:hypothetical protein
MNLRMNKVVEKTAKEILTPVMIKNNFGDVIPEIAFVFSPIIDEDTAKG